MKVQILLPYDNITKMGDSCGFESEWVVIHSKKEKWVTIDESENRIIYLAKYED